MPTFLKKKNNAKSKLLNPVTTGDSAIVVRDSSKFPLSGNFMITVWNRTQYPDPSDDISMEIMRVTAVNGRIFSVTRGQEETIAKRHGQGCAAELLFTIGQLEELESEIQILSQQITGENLWDLESGTNTIVPFFPNSNLDLGSGKFTTTGRIVVTNTKEADGGLHNAVNVIFLANPATPGTTNASFYALDCVASTESFDSDYGILAGITGDAKSFVGAGFTTDELIGVQAICDQVSGGTTTLMSGFKTNPVVQLGGVVTLGTGLHVSSEEVLGGSFTEFHGIHIGTIVGTTKFGIYDESGEDGYIKGKVGIGVTDPDTKLEVFNSTTQLKLSHDADSFITLGAADDGSLTIDSSASPYTLQLGDGNLTTTGTGRFDGGLLSNGASVIYDTSLNILNDTSTGKSIDIDNRQLMADDGVDVILDWFNVGIAQFGNSNLATTGTITTTDILGAGGTVPPLMALVVDGEGSGHQVVNKDYVDLATSSLHINEFFHDSLSTLDPLGGVDTYLMDNIEDTTGSVVSAGVPTGVAVNILNFATATNSPHLDRLLVGLYDCHVHVSRSASQTRDVTVHYELWRYEIGPTETLLATSEVQAITTVETEYTLHMNLPAEVMIDVTDRLVVKWYATVTGAGGNNPTVTIATGGEENSHFSLRINPIELASIFVPYIGAEMDVDLGANNLTTAGTGDFRTITLTPAASDTLYLQIVDPNYTGSSTLCAIDVDVTVATASSNAPVNVDGIDVDITQAHDLLFDAFVTGPITTGFNATVTIDHDIGGNGVAGSLSETGFLYKGIITAQNMALTGTGTVDGGTLTLAGTQTSTNINTTVIVSEGTQTGIAIGNDLTVSNRMADTGSGTVNREAIGLRLNIAAVGTETGTVIVKGIDFRALSTTGGIQQYGLYMTATDSNIKHLLAKDGQKTYFGTAEDLSIEWTGSGGVIDPRITSDSTGLKIGESVTTTAVEILDVTGHLNFDQVTNPTNAMGTAWEAGLSETGSGSTLAAGKYYYAITFVCNDGESWYLSSATYFPEITISGGSDIAHTDIPISPDPRVTSRKIYRTQANQAYNVAKHVHTLNDNTTTTWTDSDGTAGTGPIIYRKPNTTAGIIKISGDTAIQVDQWTTSVGVQAHLNLDGGYDNVAMGYQAAKNITTGVNNISIGTSTNATITTTSDNIAIGLAAGLNNSGSGNLSIGTYAGRLNSVGTSNQNVYLGDWCGFKLEPGDDGNTVVGNRSYYQTSGEYNVILGWRAGYSGSRILGCDKNIFIGSSAGDNIAAGASDNIIIGADLNLSSSTVDNELNIGGIIKGNMASGSESVTIVGSFFPKKVDDNAMDATNGTEGEIVYNQDDNTFYGCTTTGTPATWAAFH